MINDAALPQFASGAAVIGKLRATVTKMAVLMKQVYHGIIRIFFKQEV
jgi:hypothetical protein